MNVTDFWMRVWDEIRVHRISRKKFAEYINIPYSTFRSWLYYRRSVEVGTAYEIASALGVSLEYLITGTEGKSERIRMKQIRDRKTTEVKMKKLLVELQGEMAKM